MNYLIRIGNCYFVEFLDGEKVVSIPDNQPYAFTQARKYNNFDEALADANVFDGLVIRMLEYEEL